MVVVAVIVVASIIGFSTAGWKFSVGFVAYKRLCKSEVDVLVWLFTGAAGLIDYILRLEHSDPEHQQAPSCSSDE